MSIRAVIFDFGGVLVRMVDEQPRRELAEQLGVPLSRIDHLVFDSETAREASRGEIRVSQHWRAVGKALGIPWRAMPQFLEKYWSADEVNWRLLDFIRELRPQYKVGMLSNAWDDLRQTLHQRWNIDGLFDDLVISAEVKMVKPDARIFHLAVERLQVQASQAVFVDDISENVEAACREGLQAFQYQDSDQVLEDLRRVLTVH